MCMRKSLKHIKWSKNPGIKWKVIQTKKSITSFNKVEKSIIGDLDFLDFDLFTQDRITETKTFNQEIRLSNKNTKAKIYIFMQLADWVFTCWSTDPRKRISSALYWKHKTIS